MGGHPVVRDLRSDRGGVSVLCLEGLRVACVESHAFAGQQFLVDGVAYEGVPKSVRGAIDDEYARDRRRASGAVDVIGIPGVDCGEQLVFDPHSAGRDETQNALGLVVEGLVPGEEHVAQTRRKAIRVLEPVEVREFFDEERHPIGAFVEDPEIPRLGGAAANRTRHLPNLLAVEPAQFET